MQMFLENNLKTKDQVMKQRILSLLLADFENTDLDPNLLEFAEKEDWEQLRVIKQQVDAMWKALKEFSEKVLVTAKIKSMVESFPKPKDLKPRK